MRNVLAEADTLINGDRAKKYGAVTESFPKASDMVSAMLTDEERQRIAGGYVPPTVIAKVMLALKLVRESYTPGNADHLLDAAGYLGLLDQLKAADSTGRRGSDDG